jgi:hypothetical protein
MYFDVHDSLPPTILSIRYTNFMSIDFTGYTQLVIHDSIFSIACGVFLPNLSQSQQANRCLKCI